MERIDGRGKTAPHTSPFPFLSKSERKIATFNMFFCIHLTIREFLFPKMQVSEKFYYQVPKKNFCRKP